MISRPRNFDPLSCQKFHINQPPVSSRHGTILQRSDAIQPANPVGSWCKVISKNTRKGALRNSHCSEDTLIASSVNAYTFYSQFAQNWKSRLGSVVFGQRTLTLGLPSHLVLLKIAICYHESFVFWILFHEPSTSPQVMSKFPFQILQTLRNKSNIDQHFPSTLRFKIWSTNPPLLTMFPVTRLYAGNIVVHNPSLSLNNRSGWLVNTPTLVSVSQGELDFWCVYIVKKLKKMLPAT